MVRKMVVAGETGGSWLEDHELVLRSAAPGTKPRRPTAPAEGLILMDAGQVGLDWRAGERSRARVATALGTTVQSRMARGSVARVMQTVEWIGER